MKALLYHTFAALGGHTRSEMTIAYRMLMGIGTPRSCEDAVKHYKSVADKCISSSLSVLTQQSPISAPVHQAAVTFLAIHTD